MDNDDLRNTAQNAFARTLPLRLQHGFWNGCQYCMAPMDAAARWTPQAAVNAVRDRMRQERLGASRLWDTIELILRESYLPREIYSALVMEEANGQLKIEHPSGAYRVYGRDTAPFLFYVSPSLPSAIRDNDTRLRYHTWELQRLRNVVSQTYHFTTTGITDEKTWHTEVYRPMLLLVVEDIRSVVIEDITMPRDPQSSQPGHENPPSTGPHSIDYAMVLQPPVPPARAVNGETHNINGKGIARPTPHASKSKSTAPAPLREMRAGVFIKCTTDKDAFSSETADLVRWLFRWYQKACDIGTPESTSNLSQRISPPLVPIIHVRNAAWDLYFAFPSQEIYGPIEIGSTGSVLDAYRLLGVLKALTIWTSTEYSRWARICLRHGARIGG